MGPPIDAAHGVDPRQPETLLEIPDADVLQRLASLWQRSKKPTSAILLFDQSGSMSGRPLEEAKLGARTFLHTLHDDDEVTLIAFSHKVGLELGPWRLGDRRADLERAIDGLKAGGGTALYDAVAAAYRRALERAVAAPARIHAVVVMTDGQDEDSRLSLERLTATFGESDVKVLAIGYGNGADAKVLGRIAEAARGVYQKGTLENIASVFEEMGAFL
jgi:Ca-activated chloride channel family protein